MTELFIFVRTVVPLGVMVICVVALSFLHERITPREWGVLIWFWGCLGLVLLEAAVASCVPRLAQSATLAAGKAGFTPALLLALSLALSLRLVRRMRALGQSMLSVLFRPPRDIIYCALHGRPFVPVTTLFFAIEIGAFSGTYALTNWRHSLAGR